MDNEGLFAARSGLSPNCSVFVLFFARSPLAKKICPEYFMVSLSSFDLVQFQRAFETAVCISPSISAVSSQMDREVSRAFVQKPVPKKQPQVNCV